MLALGSWDLRLELQLSEFSLSLEWCNSISLTEISENGDNVLHVPNPQ